MSDPEMKALQRRNRDPLATLPRSETSILHLAQRKATETLAKPFRLDRGAWDQSQGADCSACACCFASSARWMQIRPPGLCPLAGRSAFAADGPRGREPRLAGHLWHGPGRNLRRFRHARPKPEYRELLDWLAVDFMEHGWSQKHLIRTIVTSATYRQLPCHARTAGTRSAQPLLARGPRFRADAEVVRDIALTVSGLITPKSAAPAFSRPCRRTCSTTTYFKPDYWKPPKAPERYRRTLYIFRRRSMPDPVADHVRRPQRRLGLCSPCAIEYARSPRCSA